MDCAKVGGLIRGLRLEKGMTQRELADALRLSDRTISKWERGAGCPDVSLLRELSGVLGVRIEELLSGDLELNDRDGGNMRKIRFYVCPDCGNILFGTGSAEISCCGRKLSPLVAKEQDERHTISAEEIDGELYVTLEHEMEKGHYIAFVALVCCDRVLLARLYPEQDAAARVPAARRGDLYAFCSGHGLFKKTLAR